MPKAQHDLKFNELLQSIPADEYKALLTFVRAFGKQTVVDLLKEFTDVGPPFKAATLSEAKLCERLHINATKDLKSQGYQLILLYLIWREVASIGGEFKGLATHSSIQHLLSLLSTFERLNLPEKHHKDLRKHIVKMLESAPDANPLWHLDSYRLAIIDANAAKPSVKRQGDETIRKAIRELDRFYLAERLRLCAELLNRHAIINTSETQDFDKYMLGMAKSGGLLDSLAVTLYAALYETLRKPSNDHAWKKYKALLLAKLPQLDKDEAAGLMTLAINNCILKAVAGRPEYNKEATTLYRQMDEYDLITADGLVSPWMYKNMIEFTLRSEERELAEVLAEKYKHKLPKGFEFMWDCSRMQVAFHDGHYEEARRWLSMFESSAKRLDPNFILWVKSCEACIHVAIGSDGTQNPLDALIKLVQRNKVISRERRAAWQNFIRIIKALTHKLHAGVRERRETLDELEQQVLETGGIAQRDWLLKWIRQQKARPAGAERAK